jgi:formylmethanofuran dehydrogenase subunit B
MNKWKCSRGSDYPAISALRASRGVHYNPDETAANDVLYRKEVDAAMIIAADAAAHFPANSVRNLQKSRSSISILTGIQRLR